MPRQNEACPRAGRTVVLVSHQLGQIRRLCERIIWIDGGQIREEGPTGKVIAAYEETSMRAAQGDDGASVEGVFLGWNLGMGGNIRQDGLRETTFSFLVNVKEPIRRGHFGLHIYNDATTLVASWGFDGSGVRDRHPTHRDHVAPSATSSRKLFNSLPAFQRRK